MKAGKWGKKAAPEQAKLGGACGDGRAPFFFAVRLSVMSVLSDEARSLWREVLRVHSEWPRTASFRAQLREAHGQSATPAENLTGARTRDASESAAFQRDPKEIRKAAPGGPKVDPGAARFTGRDTAGDTRPSRRSGEPRQSARAKAARNERRRRQQQVPRQKRQSSHAAKCRGAWAETSTYVLSKTEIRRRRQRRRIDETHTPSLPDSAFSTEKSVRNAISQRAKTSRALAQPSDGTSGALRRSEK